MRPRGIVPRAALAAFAAALALGALVLVVAAGLELRNDLTPISERLGARADAVASLDPGDRAQAGRALSGAGHGRVYGPGGAILASRGSDAFWNASSTGPVARRALAGLDGALYEGSYEVQRRTASGATVVLRESLPPGHTGFTRQTWLWALAALVLVALVAAALAALTARRQRATLGRVAYAADAIGTAAELATPDLGPTPEWGSVSAALVRAARRTGDFRDAAEVRFDALSAAIGPLSTPAAARTPAGATVRNQALESLLRGTNGDGPEVEQIVARGLSARGAVSRRAGLSDGRSLDIDAWPVPGGRVVTVVDRSEAQRAERLRTRLSGGAMRSLRPPIAEIQDAAEDLYRTSLPRESAATVQRILRQVTRLDRLTRALLRGGPDDVDERPVQRTPVGIAGLLFDAARVWDVGLRPRALRVELDLSSDLPPADSDPALLEEVLGELVENAAKFSRRGDTITISARRTGDGEVEVYVRDSGDGFSPEDARDATQFFYRGRNADTMPGSGLGLGVANAICARIGARMEIVPGRGGGVRLLVPAGAPSPVASDALS